MAIIITAVTGGLFFCVLAFLLTMHFKSKDIYTEFLEALQEKDFKLKKILHIGLYLNATINVLEPLPYDIKAIIGRKKMQTKANFIELYGTKYGEYFYINHQANKTVVAFIIELSALALALLLCAQNDSSTALFAVVGGTVFSLISGTLMESTISKKIEERRLKMRMEFPEFVNKLVLLVNSGMTVSRAWDKIVTENKKNNPLYDELAFAQKEIHDGVPESIAFEAFGRRCKTKEIMKFVSVIVSNLKKGGSEVVPTLLQQSSECWELRKNAAKELGAQAGTKMMLPMVFLLFAIILVVGGPAVIMMNGI